MQLKILAPSGRLDVHNAGALEARMMALLDDADAGLVLDVGGLDYISSAGLRVVALAAKQARRAGSRFVLCGLNAANRDTFEISGMLPSLVVEPDRGAALARFGAATMAAAEG
jgi:stage II sporulation protein AA (anti-sigma F factor antagonist)